MLNLWYHPIYTDGLDPGARFPRERYQLVRAGLEGIEDVGGICWNRPEAIAVEDLLLAHDSDYVDEFLAGTLSEEKIRRIGLRPWTEEIVERTLILTNGTVEATRHVLEKGGSARAGNLGGGTHHAYFDFGSGYCIFNDLAIAARIAQRDFGVGRVLILDLDVHQGDGTAAIFEEDPSVRTVSFHCGKNFPFRKMQSDHDEIFEEGTKDEEFLRALESRLRNETEIFKPDLILFQAGVDPLATDRLGHLEMTHEGLRKRNALVFSHGEEQGIPLVVTMGGGYGVPIETSVAAHTDLFLQAAGYLR
ncbi:UNVERIFIED_CONTAM: hypothetical protein GTU68_056229 [Idotea baltica]|nr:hypothetical protein [Idotea baltica]